MTFELYVSPDGEHPSGEQPSTIIRMSSSHTQAESDFAGIKENSVVRFLAELDSTVTDYLTVRSISRTPESTIHWDKLTFVVSKPLILQTVKNFRVHLVREWIPRPLKLQTRYQLVTACEIKAFAFTGLASATLYEGTDKEVPQHDYLGLEIKEIPGTVKSTNHNMQNMLAVLPTHMPAYPPASWTEARDGMIYLPEGLAKSTFESQLLAVNSITPWLIDCRCNLMSMARFHLWIRLWADTF
jgi:hypothetical protein